MKKTIIHFASLFSIVCMVSCNKNLMSDSAPLLSTSDAAANAVTVLAVATNGWMTQLPDSVSLAALSIPGSHDAGARYEPISGTAKCQDLTIGEQLEAGIRFLDIRCRHYEDAFVIHHGSVYQHLNFDDVLNACNSFLSSHPGETIVMCVKEEYDAYNNTRSFEETFDAYVAQNPSQWYLGVTVPTLGQVRGKIVLLRRFAATSPKGIDASSNWSDNTTFTINNGNVIIRVQDQYQVPSNSDKWTAITNLFSEAYSGSQSTLYINFSSGYKPLIFGIPSITTVSNYMNPQLSTWFTSNTQGRYGIIPMDFSNSTRASQILETNF